MKKMRRWLKTMLVGGLSAFLLVEGAFASTLQMGYRPYQSNVGAGTYYYSDSYFLESSLVDNVHLLGLSQTFAFGTENKDWLQKEMEEIGFEDIRAEEMDIATRDTIGSVIGHKTLEGGGQLVSVTVRGLSYKSEWASNVLAGAEGIPSGFQKAADKVIARLKTYLTDYNLSSAKIWITGYSRAASVTNVVGEYINEHLEEFGLKAEDLFVYAFEPAATSEKTTPYSNMVSTRCAGDIVPYAYFEAWGLHHPGKIVSLGSSVLLHQYTLTDYMGGVDVSTCPTVDADAFLQETVDLITKHVSRQDYAKMEESLSNLLNYVFTMDEATQQKFMAIFSGDLFNNLMSDTELIGAVMGLMFSSPTPEAYLAVAQALSKALLTAIQSGGLSLTQEETLILSTALIQAVQTLGPVVMEDFNSDAAVSTVAGGESISDLKLGKAEGFEDFLAGVAQEGENQTEDYVAGYAEGYLLGAAFEDYLEQVCEATWNGTQLPIKADETVWAQSTGTLYHVFTIIQNAGTLVGAHVPANVYRNISALDSYYSAYPDTPDPGQADLIVASGVEEIEEEAFAGTAVRFAVIPRTCTKIGERAFADCPNLEVVYFEDIRKADIPASLVEGSGSGSILVAAGYNP